MIIIEYLQEQYTLDDLKWSGPNLETVAFLQSQTDVNALSGAEADPDFAVVRMLQEDLQGIEIVKRSEPDEDFDPEAIY